MPESTEREQELEIALADLQLKYNAAHEAAQLLDAAYTRCKLLLAAEQTKNNLWEMLKFWK